MRRKSSADADLFRRGLHVSPAPSARPGKRVRNVCAQGRKLPARPAPEGSVCPVARREACALWALGPKAQSDPKRGSETMSATVREARMIEQPGHLAPKGPKRPEGAPEGSASPVGCWAEGPKRPAGVSKYKGCARPARRTPIFARERNERWARPAPAATIERPGKAGRYEFTLEGCGPPNLPIEPFASVGGGKSSPPPLFLPLLRGESGRIWPKDGQSGRFCRFFRSTRRKSLRKVCEEILCIFAVQNAFSVIY